MARHGTGVDGLSLPSSSQTRALCSEEDVCKGLGLSIESMNPPSQIRIHIHEAL